MWDSNWAVWLRVVPRHLSPRVWGQKGDKVCKTANTVGDHTFDCFYATVADFAAEIELILEKRGAPKAW